MKTEDAKPRAYRSNSDGAKVAGLPELVPASKGVDRLLKRLALIGLALGVLLVGSLPAFTVTASPSQGVHSNGTIFYWDD